MIITITIEHVDFISKITVDEGGMYKKLGQYKPKHTRRLTQQLFVCTEGKESGYQQINIGVVTFFSTN